MRKSPTTQRHQGERAEIELERGQHLLDLRAATRRTLNRKPRRQTRAYGALRVVQRRGILQPDIDAIHAAKPIERELRCGDIKQHEVAVHYLGRTVVPQDAADGEPAHGVANRQIEAAAD